MVVYLESPSGELLVIKDEHVGMKGDVYVNVYSGETRKNLSELLKSPMPSHLKKGDYKWKRLRKVKWRVQKGSKRKYLTAHYMGRVRK